MQESLHPQRGAPQAEFGPLARAPRIGFMLGSLALLVFGLLTLGVVTHGPLTGFDNRTIEALHAWATHAPPWLTDLMRFGSSLGFYGVLGTIVVFAILWIARRRWREFSMLLLTAVGGQVVFDIIAALIHRPRPHFGDAFEGLTANSFPSGHVTSSLLLFGLLLYIYVPGIRSATGRVLFILGGVLLVAWIAFSRLYLGSHYPTDVIAGFALGLGWGTLTVSALETFWSARRSSWAPGSSKPTTTPSATSTTRTTSSGNTPKRS
jgi:membrane-associated phospholipid phosphatase